MERNIRFLFNERRVIKAQNGFVLGVTSASGFPSTDVVYISGTGDDTDPGTLIAPFRTIYRALEETELNIIAKYQDQIDVINKYFKK